MLSVKPLGMRGLTVSDCCNTADMCGINLSVNEQIYTDQTMCNDQVVGTFSQMESVQFSIQEGAISIEAWQIMTGRAIVKTIENNKRVISYSANVGDVYPTFNLVGVAKSGDDGSEVHIRLLEARLTSGLSGEFDQDSFLTLGASGIAQRYEIVYYSEGTAPRMSSDLESILPAYRWDALQCLVDTDAVLEWGDYITGTILRPDSLATAPEFVDRLGQQKRLFVDGVDDFTEGLILDESGVETTLSPPMSLAIVVDVELLDGLYGYQPVIEMGGVGSTSPYFSFGVNSFIGFWEFYSGIGARRRMGAYERGNFVEFFRVTEGLDIEHYRNGEFLEISPAIFVGTYAMDRMSVGLTPSNPVPPTLRLREIIVYDQDVGVSGIESETLRLRKKWRL